MLFIDEIQSSPEAVAVLRYFYETLNHLHVIAAGSLLESLLDRHISFPVGRVEYLQMHPLTFEEFLVATGESQAVVLSLTKFTPSLYREIRLVADLGDCSTYGASLQ